MPQLVQVGLEVQGAPKRPKPERVARGSQDSTRTLLVRCIFAYKPLAIPPRACVVWAPQPSYATVHRRRVAFLLTLTAVTRIKIDEPELPRCEFWVSEAL